MSTGFRKPLFRIATTSPANETPGKVYSVEFVVGVLRGPPATFFVPSNKLVTSTYFKESLHTPPRGLVHLRFEIPDVDSKDFRIYHTWLTEGVIRFGSNGEYSGGEHIRDKSLSLSQCYPLLAGWLLGEKFKDKSYQDAVVEELDRVLAPDVGKDADTFDYCYFSVIYLMFKKPLEIMNRSGVFAKGALEGRFGGLGIGQTYEHFTCNPGEPCSIHPPSTSRLGEKHKDVEGFGAKAIAAPPRIEVTIPKTSDFKELARTPKSFSAPSSQSESVIYSPNLRTDLPIPLKAGIKDASTIQNRSQQRGGSHTIPQPIMEREHPLRKKVDRQTTSPTLPPISKGLGLSSSTTEMVNVTAIFPPGPYEDSARSQEIVQTHMAIPPLISYYVPTPPASFLTTDNNVTPLVKNNTRKRFVFPSGLDESSVQSDSPFQNLTSVRYVTPARGPTDRKSPPRFTTVAKPLPAQSFRPIYRNCQLEYLDVQPLPRQEAERFNIPQTSSGPAMVHSIKRKPVPSSSVEPSCSN